MIACLHDSARHHRTASRGARSSGSLPGLAPEVEAASYGLVVHRGSSEGCCQNVRRGQIMRTVHIPYHRGTVALHIDEGNLLCVLEPKAFGSSVVDGALLVRQSLDHPIDTDRLREIARGKKTALIITSDHTRAMPSRITLPILLAEIRSGSPDIEVTVLIGTGLHRATAREEMVEMFGEDLVQSERIVVHDAFDDSTMRSVCVLPSGTHFAVNRLVFENELVVTEGFIEPHFFAGFSGGRKSILPGIASAISVNENHSAKAIATAGSRAGILDGNPIHEDMLYAAKNVPVHFCLNVVMDGQRRIVGSFAGDVESAHATGCEFLGRLAGVSQVTSDIVIASNGGYPMDQNLYQSPKGVSTAAACAGEDGVIIMVASCCDGIGGDEFKRLLQAGSPQQIIDTIMAIPPKESIPEQWCAQILAQILVKHKVILVTQHMDHSLVRQLHLIPASTVDEALAMAYEIKGRQATVTVIPDGLAVIVEELQR